MDKAHLDALNFEVKAIETFLGYAFTGETTEEKQAFVEKHRNKRVEVTSELLRQSYLDYKKEHHL